MKALVLAGGRGKRLDELSANNNKCMIEINGISVIEHSFNNAINAGIDEIIIVVGYRAEDIINRYGNSFKGITLKYVIQWEQGGLVHAMDCAKASLDNNDFMLLLGDEIMLNPRHKDLIKEYYDSKAFVMCGVLWVDDKDLIKRTYTIIQDSDNNISRLVEKPRNPLNNYMGTGDCVFNKSIFDYIDITPIHHERKEKELPDLIQCAIDDGQIVKSFIVCDQYTNINTKDDIRMAEEYIF